MKKTPPSLFVETPSIIVEQRKFICSCNCNVDFKDPCATCPSNKWGPFFCDQTTQEKDTPEFPSLAEQAVNFSSAVTSEIKSKIFGEKKLQPEEIKKRFSICKACEFFHKQSGRCKKCGCFLKMKTAWRSQKCPIGKW